MDMPSEMLIRATIHDMANVLAGVQGVLDLTPPGRPLGDRDRDRLEAVLEEGLATLARARHLAVGTLPEAGAEEGLDWQAHLESDLKALGVIFRRPIRIQVDDVSRSWPGALLRDYLRAAVKQVLPYAQGEALELDGQSDSKEWRVRLRTVPFIPDGLIKQPEDRPGDVGGRYALRAAAALGLSLSCENGVLTIRIPRP